ncbi:MAG: GntR family transcriptional regulator [Devosia sp.]|uniref:GntR family transcriptional regulator n=1 Tax=Devosia sp. TaxID=1871048 RepID=UPI001A0680B7|nr:GntR family transcriptional regulator [Devosia sp.]MBF0680716.1 GntR family transcriptional regulator [Devosia sp.]
MVVTPTNNLEEFGYRTLREQIVTGQLLPGQKLVQEDLARQLGVSRTPLRSAIAALEREGFVSLSPRGEATVLEFGPRRIADLFEIRAVLEGLTCRLIASKIERKHTAYLRSLLQSSLPEEGDTDWSAYRAADHEFHTFLAGLIDDAFLARQLEMLQGIMTASFAQGLLRPPHETMAEHIEIIDALEAHDQDRAEQAMLVHIRKTIALMRGLRS